ncbi:MAG: ATP-binding protein [Pseudomonadota bacterium]
MAEPALRIAIVGAESTGKTALAQALAGRIAELTGLRCTWVGEHLRAWCDAQGRTPRPDEQAGIAAQQQALIDAAAARHDVVVCDTTPLMTAVYSEWIFGDRSLHAGALAQQRRCDLTLLMALDIDWQPDGLQRDGPQVRVPVDNCIRSLLIGQGLPWALVTGQDASRLESALDAVAPLLRQRLAAAPASGLFSRLAARDAAQPAWRWACDSCDAPECEHLLLRQRGVESSQSDEKTAAAASDKPKN